NRRWRARTRWTDRVQRRGSRRASEHLPQSSLAGAGAGHEGGVLERDRAHRVGQVEAEDGGDLTRRAGAHVGGGHGEQRAVPRREERALAVEQRARRAARAYPGGVVVGSDSGPGKGAWKCPRIAPSVRGDPAHAGRSSATTASPESSLMMAMSAWPCGDASPSKIRSVRALRCWLNASTCSGVAV